MCRSHTAAWLPVRNIWISHVLTVTQQIGTSAPVYFFYSAACVCVCPPPDEAGRSRCRDGADASAMEPESLRRRVAAVLVGLETALDAGVGRAAGLGASSPAVETVRRVGFPAAEEPHLHVRAHFFWLHNVIMFEISFYYIYHNDIFLSTQVTFTVLESQTASFTLSLFPSKGTIHIGSYRAHPT